MKKIAILGVVALVLLLLAVSVPVMAGGNNCTRIQDGMLEYSAGHYLDGQPLTGGYVIFGYNYQAHMFNGYYANSYLGRPDQGGLPPYEGDADAYYQRLVDEGFATTVEEAESLAAGKWYWQYRDVQLMMKWSDIWLSNKDCNDDGDLDRGGPGGTSSAAEGAWLTNHQWGINDDGDKWTYFVKIVAVPDDAELVEGVWYTADGIEIGPAIWGAYARILQVSNDKAFDEHGVLYKSPASPGFGKW